MYANSVCLSVQASVAAKYTPAVKTTRPRLQSHLRAWRLYRGLTPNDLAERTGLASTTVVKIENGKQDVTGKTLALLAAALETTPSGLLSPPNDRADIWSIWDDLREQGKTDEATAVLRAIRDASAKE